MCLPKMGLMTSLLYPAFSFVLRRASKPAQIRPKSLGGAGDPAESRTSPHKASQGALGLSLVTLCLVDTLSKQMVREQCSCPVFGHHGKKRFPDCCLDLVQDFPYGNSNVWLPRLKAESLFSNRKNLLAFYKFQQFSSDGCIFFMHMLRNDSS